MRFDSAEVEANPGITPADSSFETPVKEPLSSRPAWVPSGAAWHNHADSQLREISAIKCLLFLNGLRYFFISNQNLPGNKLFIKK